MLSLRLLGFLIPVACSAAIYENFADLPKLDFDYIIVGGGTAGNVLANRLTEQKDTSVLVLEAGQSTADVLLTQVPFFCPQATPNTPQDWNFTTTPMPGLNGRAISYPRGFGLGGSSAVNYMAYTRGSSEDYDRYARVTGDEGWGWERDTALHSKGLTSDLLPLQIITTQQANLTLQVHNFHGVNSVSLPGYPKTIDGRVIQATQELQGEFSFNLDYNSGYHLGIGWEQTTVGNGTRSSSETSYLAPGYIDRENLHVLIHSYVTRILAPNKTTSDHKPHFNTVEFTQDTGGGSVGTPHILLNSGIGNATELSTVGVTPTPPGLSTTLTQSRTVYWRNATFQAEALAEWQANRTGFIASTSANQLGFFRVEEGVLEEEPCSGENTGHYEMIFSGGIGSGTIPATGSYLTIGIILICPLSRGTITINGTDPLSPPLHQPELFITSTGHDRHAARPSRRASGSSLRLYGMTTSSEYQRISPIWRGA
ncbi:alcohol dehydrogenase [Armillaria novae-zelandiae]|uniref:Alcohol dehydrogenase n=1 Tax=Armillaria novae-zelandiae TaxID=153914 RepID=A0AA39NTE8_9AGAR|nr:alcohol dehydrogenase [Armillaria novae-zelandiae]